MSFVENNYVSDPVCVDSCNRRFDLNLWFCNPQRIFSLHDSCPLSSSLCDREILKYYGIEIERYLETGAYSKAPIYYGSWNNKEIVIKAVKIHDRPSKHARSELAVVRCIKHPHIVDHYAYFRATNRIYSIMEWMPNGTLGHYLRTNSFINHSVCKVMFKEISSAVSYLHSIFIAHRDIKDENIALKIDSRGQPLPKLIDFGFAVKLSSYSDLCTNYCGTRSYKSPELLHAEGPYSPFKADVWAMGILLYKMLMKKYPNYCQERRKIIADYSALPNWGEELVRFILKISSHERPTMDTILHTRWLRGIYVKEKKYF